MSKKKTTKVNKATTKSKVVKAASNPDLVPLKEAMKPTGNGKGKKKDAANGREKAPKKLSCLDAAAQVLKDEGKPMTCKAMIDAMFSQKLWHSDAPTPAATLSSALLREIVKKKGEARFVKTDRGLFKVKN